MQHWQNTIADSHQSTCLPLVHPETCPSRMCQSSHYTALSERHTPFTDALTRHAIFVPFLAPGALPSRLSARLCISTDSSSVLFVLTPSAGLYCLPLSDLRANFSTRHVALSPSPSLPAASSTLFLSPASTYLAVTSPQSCCVVKLPRSLASVSSSRQSSVACRSYDVGPLSPTSFAFTLLHAAFHPLSSHHLLLLLDSSSHSSALHLYNLTADLDQPELVVPLPSSSSSARAVSFCFAGKAGWSAWTVYVLYSDGRISTVCPLLPMGAAVRGADVAVLRQSEQSKVRRTGDEDARTRLAWLKDTFGSGDDEADELVVSRSSSLRPLASSAMDVGSSSVLRGEDAVALVSLSASAVQLARIYGAGRVDVLAGVSEVQPRFVEGPLARAAEVTLAAVDTIALPTSKPPALLPLTPTSSTLTMISPTAAHSLSFPYLTELAHVMSDPSLPSSALSTALSRVQTQLSSSEQMDGVVAGCVLADIIAGRQLLLLTTDGVRVLNLSDKLTLANMRMTSAANTTATAQQVASAANSSSATFRKVLAPYMSKYRNHHIDLSAAHQSHSLSSPASFAAFLSTLPQFQSTITDLHTLHGEITTRAAVLAAVSNDSATTIDTLCDSMVAIRERQQLLRERLAVTSEFAAETGKRIERLISDWRRRKAGDGDRGSPVSHAERDWRVDVVLREEDTMREKRRVDDVSVRVAQLAALRDRRRAVQASEQRHGDLRLGSVELGRLQVELSGQTRLIEELIADSRDMRQQVRVKEREDIEEPEAEQRYRVEEDELVTPHLLHS